MTVFSGKSERKLQRNKESTACFQTNIAVEDGRAVERSHFSKGVCCLTETEIVNAQRIEWDRSLSTDLLTKLKAGRGCLIIWDKAT